MGEYQSRLQVLCKAYMLARKNNTLYKDSIKKQTEVLSKLNFINSFALDLQKLDSIITAQEKVWQELVLHRLEYSATQALAVVYPDDGYTIKLSSRILRGKIHIDCSVYSYYSKDIPGDIADTQGRLFQQIVSFAALMEIMNILGANTVYIDEAFSGVAKVSIELINKLLRSYMEASYNIVLIAQDSSIAEGIPGNILLLSRSIDNKTSVQELGG